MILIVGSGPSGLIASWACMQSGEPFQIISNNVRKPELLPFSYLHEDCGLPVRVSVLYKYFIPMMMYQKTFSDMYSKKVYGSEEITRSSNEFFDTKFDKIWNMQDAIDFIWDLVKSRVSYKEIKEYDLFNFSKEYDHVICTAPLNQIYPGATYKSVKCYVKTVPAITGDNYVIFNAYESENWYRAGEIFGKGFIEYKDGFDATASLGCRIMPITKVISCDSFNLTIPENVLLTGRFGAWDKHCLVSDVYRRVLDVLNG